MTPDTSSPTPPVRTNRWWARASRVVLWLVLGAWALFFLMLGALHFWIVPRISDWRGDLERWATQAVGQTVQIAELRALDDTQNAWLLTPPALGLRGVRLLDAQGAEALHLPDVQISVSLASLWRLGFERLLIDGPVLHVRRLSDGRILVAGQDVDQPAAESDPRALQWLLDQRELLIRNGKVTWSDELRQAPPLALSDVQIQLRRQGRQHHWQIDAVPPSDWGKPFSLSASLTDPLLPWQNAAEPVWLRWHGQIVAEFAAVDIRQLRHHLDGARWGMDWQTGVGSLVLQTEMQAGLPVALQARLGLRDVHVRLGKGLEPLRLRSLQGPLRLERSDQSWRVQSDGLTLQTEQEAPWSGGRWDWGVQLSADGVPTQVSLVASDVDLGRLASLAERLPLGPSLNKALAQLKPVGVLNKLDGRWEAPAALDAPWWQGRYALEGELSQLALQSQASGRRSSYGPYPVPGRPGVEGALVRFSADQQGGRAELQVRDGALDLPGVFEESRLPLQRLDGQLRWQHQGERWDVWFDKLTLSNPDAQGQIQGHWHTSEPEPGIDRFPGVLDLTAQLTRTNLTRLHRYLPLTVLPDVRRYLKEAVRAGTATAVDFRVRGRIYDMPVADPAKGEFRIRADVKDVQFDYVPPFMREAGALPWPALTQLSGEFLFDQLRLGVTGINAQLDGMPGLQLKEAAVHIHHLDGNQSPRLEVQTRATGPGASMLAYVHQSPVDGLLGGALTQARLTGPAVLDLTLDLPFDQIVATQVKGRLQLDGNDLLMHPQAPPLLATRGEVQFTHKGFSVAQARAQLYGGEVRFDGGWTAGGAGPRFKGEGRVSADGLRTGAPALVSRLLGGASGNAAYRAQLGFVDGEMELDIQSDLQGMALSLPAPLGKRADEAVPLHLQRVMVAAEPVQDRLLLDWGQGPGAVRMRYDRELKDGQARVLRGGVAVGLEPGMALPAPESGVHANIRLPRLNAAEWVQVLGSGAGLDMRTLADTESDTGAQGYVPDQLALRTDVLDVDGRRFDKVVLGAARVGRNWRANIDAPEVGGYVELSLSPSGHVEHWRGRLARLHLPASSAREADRLASQTTELPGIDVLVSDFRIGERELGRLELAAEPRGSGAAREWRLNKLLIQTPEARLRASGNWSVPVALGAQSAAQRRTQLGVQIDIDDSGLLLQRFGHPGVVRAAKGRIEGQIGWYGTPFQPDWASATGQIQLDVQRGQFLKVDPGAAKLLAVLNLQALPRRLALDFSDVFSEGFVFDFVRGDARITRGVISTNNLQMKGVTAAVLMEGSANIVTETQDIRAVVVPEVNAGTASLIATAINPAVGLGTFLAQFLLNQPLQSAATQTFHITGTWADPKIDKLARPDATTPPAEPPR